MWRSDPQFRFDNQKADFASLGSFFIHTRRSPVGFIWVAKSPYLFVFAAGAMHGFLPDGVW